LGDVRNRCEDRRCFAEDDRGAELPRHSVLDGLYNMFRIERDIAERAFEATIQKNSSCSRWQMEQVKLLHNYYVHFGLSRGQSQTSELARGIAKQAVGLRAAPAR
jgi:hypothetical protein